MQDLTLDDFLPRIGDTFETEGDRRIALTLAEASALPASTRASGSFRLLFRGPGEPLLPQAIHALRHHDTRFEIFLVPLQPDQAGAHYEAIFN